jgi:putative tryptophan/tyrosine transport system substrate-binding protein
MRRREFLGVVGAAAVWPRPARAQQPTMPAVGFLGTDSPYLRERRLRAFRNGLSEAGYDGGRNVTIEFRWRTANTINWRHWRPIWFNVGSA